MTGLSLDRFECHARFPQPGQTGVTQADGRWLVADRRGRGRRAMIVVDPIDRQWLSAASVLSSTTNTRSVAAFAGRSTAQIVADRGEEHVRDRHHPVMAALAFGDEQRPLRRPEYRRDGDRGPRSGAARQAPSRRPSPGPDDVRSAPSSALTSRWRQRSWARSAGLAPAEPCWRRPCCRRVGMPRGTGFARTSVSPRATRYA